jgi:hypothetical protein
MGIIGIIGLILTALRALPQIIGIVREIIQLIHSLKGSRASFDQEAVLTEFKNALKLAREKKDVSALKALHDKLGALCASGLCHSASGPGMPLR